MDTEDARRLSPAEQHERHRQVIRSWKRGGNKRQIGRDVGLSYSAACKIIDRYEVDGPKSLVPRTRGRKAGELRNLGADQEAHIQRLICERRPEQLKMDFALWSRPAVRGLIEHECGISLHVRPVGKYLARWGFTPQKPIRRAYEQSPQAVKAWLDDEYRAIARRVKAENAEIHRSDRTAGAGCRPGSKPNCTRPRMST